MLKLQSVFFAIVLLFALTAISLSKSHRTFTTKGHHNHVQSQQQAPAADQRGTEQSPLVVQPLSTKKSTEEANRDAREAQEKTNSDWWTWILSVLTLAVLFGQAIILAVQAYFLNGTLKVTKAAADAAQAQVRTFATVEGPLPLVTGLKIVPYALVPGTAKLEEDGLIDHLDPGPIPVNCRVIIGFENKGRSPAIMRALCIEKFVGTALPPNLTYTHVEPWGLVLEKGPIWIKATDELANITAAEVEAAAVTYPDGGAFWVYGYFSYLNLLNETVERKFLARWDLGQGFVADNRPGYT